MRLQPPGCYRIPVPEDESLPELFRQANRRLRHLAWESLQPWDVTPGHSRALGVLARGGPLRLSELAERLRIVPRSTTEVSTRWRPRPGRAPTRPARPPRHPGRPDPEATGSPSPSGPPARPGPSGSSARSAPPTAPTLAASSPTLGRPPTPPVARPACEPRRRVFTRRLCPSSHATAPGRCEDHGDSVKRVRWPASRGICGRRRAWRAALADLGVGVGVGHQARRREQSRATGPSSWAHRSAIPARSRSLTPPTAATRRGHASSSAIRSAA
jgi:hypothetical protein